MFNYLGKTVIFIVAILILVNKFYSPIHCDKLSGKSIQYSLGEINGLKQCADSIMCKVGGVSNNNLGGVNVKNWQCVPLGGKIVLGRLLD